MDAGVKIGIFFLLQAMDRQTVDRVDVVDVVIGRRDSRQCTPQDPRFYTSSV